MAHKWFFLDNTPPVIDNMNVTSNTRGWGDTYYFSIEVDDTQLDDVNCSLYLSTDNITYTYFDNDIVSGGVGTCNISINTFDCSWIGNNYFKLNIYDGTADNTFELQTGSNPIVAHALQSGVDGDFILIYFSGVRI